MTVDLEVAYLGLQVPDPAGFGMFLKDIVGLVPGETTSDGAATWRNDDRVHRFIVEEGPANDAVFVGLEAASPEAFDRAIDRARATGATVTDGTASQAAGRRVEALARIDTPWGVPFELVHGLASAAEPFDSHLVPGGFVTKDQGFGHVVFVTTDLDACDRFAHGSDALGFVQSDWLEIDLGGLPLTVRFYHCNPRHHSLAIGAAPIELPQKLHHVMVETVAQDNVGAAFDRTWNAGLPIANAIGKHDNDKMFSFYVVTPAGFQLEFGYGARTIDEPWTDDHRYDRISEWGHQPIQPPLRVMSVDLKGSVTLVTGSSSGIGASIAAALADLGAGVVVNSSSSVAAGQQVAGDLPDAIYRQADVSDPDQANRLVAEAVDHYGRLDIVVNNAGTTAVIPHEDLDAATNEIWERILRVNVIGPWNVIHAAAPHLRATGDGIVLNVTSVAGVRPLGSSIPYAVSKAALNHLTVLLANVLGPEIRVNAVAPGLIDTPWTDGWDDVRDAVRGTAPLRRSGTPEDVADACIALLTARYATGQVLVLDGGLALR